MLDDLKFALRSLLHARAFTAVALAVLALGIGAGTAIFSVVDAVVLRGLPFDEHDRLAAVLEHDTLRPTTFGGGTTTAQTFLDWHARQQSFESLAAVANWTYRLRNEGGEPADARAQRVTSEFFPALRVYPILGRVFTSDDEIEGHQHVAILSYGFWQRRFGGAPDVVGKTIELDEEQWEIVGVLPADFAYPVASNRPSEIFAPVAFRPDEQVRKDSRNYNWTTIGRLKPGISIAQAHDDMNRIAAALDAQYPKWSPGRRVRVISLHYHLVGRVRPWMLLLLGAVGLVLLIACANVANLMLVRATGRQREMGIRAALGAGRWRLVRALLVEAVALSLAGAAIGVLLAYLGVEIIRAWMPANVPRVAAIGIDWRVLAATIGTSVLTGASFGLAPAFQSTRTDLTSALKDTGRSTTAGRTTQWLRSLLVVAEVAIAAVLLVGAGLFIRSFATVMRVDTGIDYRNVIVLNVFVRNSSFEEAMTQGNEYVRRMLEAVGSVPGVTMAAAATGGTPLGGGWSRTGIQVNGVKQDGDNSIDRRGVTANYLQLLRIPLIRGRYLTDADREGAQPVMVVNQTAARKYWSGQDPIGQRAIINSVERTVVGVVGDIRHLGPEEPARPEAYAPLTQERNTGAALVIRTDGDALRALPAVKAAIWSVNNEQRLTSETPTLELQMDRLIAQRRFNMALLALFGALGLVIAAVGIYGVMSYVVAQRRSEIGVRMALGATRRHVMSMVLVRSALLMAGGLVLGTLASWPLTKLLNVQSFLFQVDSSSPAIYALAAAVLAAAGLLASAVPAFRAASIDPLEALRRE
jgi:putative ABC transport system permease protein